jgi:hypothetical protein
MFKSIRLKRTLLYAAIGGVAGLGLSYLSQSFGSSCSIMCNSWLATGYGVFGGLIISFGE